jgi:hypothetical protein
MRYELTGIKYRAGKTQTIDERHQSGFKQNQKVVGLVSVHAGSPFEGSVKLLLHHAVGKPQLLLFQELLTVRRLFFAT